MGAIAIHSEAEETPEAIVKGFLADLDSGKVTEARARLSPNYALEVVGQGSWPLGALHQGASLSALMKTFRQRFPAGLSLTIRHVTSQCDRVVVEASSEGVRRDGLTYRNDYVFIFVVSDGLIQHQREFCDIIAADEALCGPMGADDNAACSARPGRASFAQDH